MNPSRLSGTSIKPGNTLAAAGNEYPTDIWSDNTTMWVADWSDNKIYAACPDRTKTRSSSM